MHKRVMALSSRIANIQPKNVAGSEIKERAKKHLHMAQSGCVYWHGVFGGFYLNHLREGIYRHLINAENVLDTLDKTENISKYMIDDKPIIRLDNKDLSIHVDVEKRAEIIEIDDKLKAFNLINTISRKKEVYHNNIKGTSFFKKLDVKRKIEQKQFFNIYDFLGLKDKVIKKALVYDSGNKGAFIDHFIFGRYTLQDMVYAKDKNIKELSEMPYEIIKGKEYDSSFIEMSKTEDVKERDIQFGIKKRISLDKDDGFAVSYSLRNLSSKKVQGFFATELNLSMYNESLSQERVFKNTDTLILDDQWSSMQIKIKTDSPVEIWTVPIYTVNGSEGGLGRTYQYLKMLFKKKVCLKTEDTMDLTFEVKIK
jgi:alpha-amylase